jgi:hypothetical protein
MLAGAVFRKKQWLDTRRRRDCAVRDGDRPLENDGPTRVSIGLAAETRPLRTRSQRYRSCSRRSLRRQPEWSSYRRLPAP